MIWGRKKKKEPEPKPKPTLVSGPPNDQRIAKPEPQRPVEVEVAVPPSNDRTLIGPGMRVNGDLSSGSAVHIAGKILGAVTSGADIEIGADAVVKGALRGTNVTVSGTVEGPVSTTGRLLIKNSGRVVGAITVKSVLVEDGGELKGRCSTLER